MIRHRTIYSLLLTAAATSFVAGLTVGRALEQPSSPRLVTPAVIVYRSVDEDFLRLYPTSVANCNEVFETYQAHPSRTTRVACVSAE